jgi:hypothetical protein
VVQEKCEFQQLRNQVPEAAGAVRGSGNSGADETRKILRILVGRPKGE